MRFVKIFYFLGVCFFISCNNQMGNLPVSTQPSSLPSLTPLPQQVFKISSVKQTSTSNVMGLLFNPSLPSGPIANLCHLTYGGDTAQPTSSCQCVFRWKEKNDYNGSTIIIAREIRTSIVDVQAYALFCNIPPMYNNEIFDGTSVTVGVENTTQNTLGYQVQELKFIKQAGTNIGSFQDLDGNTFDNVLRYSCYEQFKRGMTVINRTDTSKSNPKTGEPVTFKIASQFCAVKADGSGGESEGCQGLPPSDNSAEAYYYSLFIPESKRGDINLENKRYKCPRVKESLRNSQVTDYWPLDTSFALSVKRSQDFNVGVEGVSNLSIGRGQTSIPSSCSDPVVKPSSIPGIGGGAATEVIPDSGLVKKCLGFARKPNGNGTCPLMKGLSGQTISTFRLRRFVAIYPPNFDTDGKMTNDAQGIDTIYVLDRAVVKPNAQNDVSGQVYFSMLGPKPCPFSFYDRKGLTRPPNENVEFYGNSKPGYASTHHPLWDKKNVDGIEFPNTDSNSSCAAALPFFNPQTGVWSVGTVHKTNPSMQHVYVRPIQPWIPHYEEDTEFLACAPEASLIVDPPMHFAKHAENFSAPWNVGWCAEVYPTQNPNVLDLDPLPKVGGVPPFTSHVVKNSKSSACVFSPLSLNRNYIDGPGGAARHPASLIADPGASVGTNQTCDRTVENPSAVWPRFPLLADPKAVEDALLSDSSYGCTLTYDAGGGKAWKYTPKQGCCGRSVNLWSGNPNSNSADANVKNTSAHLEPGTPQTQCSKPEY